MHYKIQIQKVLKKYPVLFAYVFGSYAKSRVREKSDLDIAVFFDAKIKNKAQYVLKSDLREDLAQSLKKYDRISLIVLNEAPPLMEKEVVYGGKLVYSKDDLAQTHYQAQAVSRWLDYKWHYDRFAEKLLKN